MTAAVRRTVREVFEGFESGSIQQMIYQMGTRILAEQGRSPRSTWRPKSHLGHGVEKGDELGVFTDARPPYGCLGLRLRR